MTANTVRSKTQPTDSVNDPILLSDDQLMPIFSDLISLPVNRIDRVRHGRNSRVFKVTCQDSEFIAKVYPPKQYGGRERLTTEFSALKFLWKQGVTSIPEPLQADSQNRVAIYEYIRGGRPSPDSITNSDIESATAFLGTLKSLTNVRDAESIGSAAEACFSISSIIDNIRFRLEPLHTVRDYDKNLKDFRHFLSAEFEPALNLVAKWSQSKCESDGLEFKTVIEDSERTLSPSDFGFHNSIRRMDGQLAFLDFEYFGWDDSAKTVSDFLLHPGMELASPLKQQFMSEANNVLDVSGELAKRVKIVYPLYGLKWSLILLNEFLPDHLARRVFAGGGSLDQDEILPVQLNKARLMTRKIMNDYKRFPYHD